MGVGQGRYFPLVPKQELGNQKIPFIYIRNISMVRRKEQTARILLKKYELNWKHYKNILDAMERRRNFLWIVQAALFTGWFKFFIDGHSFSLIIPIIGIILCITWIYVLTRDREFLLLVEHYLRDIEAQWNKIFYIKNDIFLIDQKVRNIGKSHKFQNTGYIFNEHGEIKKFATTRILNVYMPISIICVWLILLFYTYRIFAFSPNVCC
ncbi:MAG: hypothetical protein A2Y80_07365 [Deltaproteobacteria bacterium RBG_13_58_19]|nr:MAG: hypothetical protein A2Y80_07365 [Deltaproteobacteria bacterium RBG_13_58_19]